MGGKGDFDIQTLIDMDKNMMERQEVKVTTVDDESDSEEPDLKLTRVITHATGFLVATGGGKGYINSYDITKDFEIKLSESYLCAQTPSVMPSEITSLAISYDRTNVVFSAVYNDLVTAQQQLDEAQVKPGATPYE